MVSLCSVQVVATRGSSVRKEIEADAAPAYFYSGI